MVLDPLKRGVRKRFWGEKRLTCDIYTKSGVLTASVPQCHETINRLKSYA